VNATTDDLRFAFVIYLDNSATTRVRPEVLAAMLPYLQLSFGNPSSIHAPGRTAREALDRAREQVAAMLNCQTNEVYFAGCATMANNVALLGRARFVEANGLPRHLIVSNIEHPAVLGPAQYLESQGWRVTYLAVDKEGLIAPERLAAALADDTSMVSIMWANNEIGAVQPLSQLSQLVAAHGKKLGRDIFMHTDAVQVPGKLPIDLSAMPVSALSLSGHKFGAPKGIGILFLRRLVNVMPIIFGGGQEMGLFAGTEALPNIVAVGEAAALAKAEQEELYSRLRSYQARLFEKLLTIPAVSVTGPKDIEKRLPGHVSIAVSKAEGEALVLKSDLRGVCLSSGSACHRGIIEPSHVLKAIGLSEDNALGALRITFGVDNTEADFEQAATTLLEIFSKVKVKA
jgi:cysteine desulfurase